MFLSDSAVTKVKQREKNPSTVSRFKKKQILDFELNLKVSFSVGFHAEDGSSSINVDLIRSHTSRHSQATGHRLQNPLCSPILFVGKP
jgi:outer membrane lipopolysaccharide assembly protein LptE/RlpB